LSSADSSAGETPVLIVAAEESSALYARRILESWKDQGLRVRAFGVGNFRMAELGFDRVADSTEMAVVGLGEIWRHWDRIKNAYREILARVQK
jgi:lipid A disaccharide synthetase